MTQTGGEVGRIRVTVLGGLDFPALAAHPGLMPLAAYLDRAKAQRPGRLYQAVYWSDKDYATYSPDSWILVIDTDANKVLSAPPGPRFVGNR